MARSVAKGAPHDYDDPALVLTATGRDPAAILNWIKTNTRLLPYSGSLRGAAGVLMDRAGNSVDRALFAADLLQRAGYVARLARAQLPAERAAALRASITATAAPMTPPHRMDRAMLLKAVGQPAALDAGSIGRAADLTLKDDERFQTSVRDLYGRVLPAVQTALGQDAAHDRDLAAQADADLKDHFWVQVQTPTGWTDLDPDAAIVGSISPTATLAVSDLPAELRHRVTVRLVVESWTTGRPTESTLIERAWNAVDLAGKPITLRHRLLPEPDFDTIAKGANPEAAYADALSTAWVFEPVLTVGGEDVMDRLFTLGGDVLPANDGTLRQLGVPAGLFGGLGTRIAGGGGMGAIAGLFGGTAPAPSGPPDESAGAKVTAEWMDFEVAVPGRSIVRERRTVFDLVGPAARAASGNVPPRIDRAQKQARALALTGEMDAFVFGATPSESWIRRMAGAGIATAADAAVQAVRSGTSAIEAARQAASVRTPLPLWSWAFNRVRSTVLAQGWPVAPNVVLLWSVPGHTSSNRLLLRKTVDIVTNQTASDLTFSGKVAQGVLDTIIEDTCVGGSGRWNAAALHARDVAKAQQWVRLDPGDLAASDRLDLPADAKIRIREDLSRGRIVIAPQHREPESAGGDIAWWRIDRQTGETVGVSDTGFGASMVEYAVIIGRGMLCAFMVYEELSHSGHGALGPAPAIVGGAFCAVGIGNATWELMSLYGEVSLGGLIGEGLVELLVELIILEEAPE